MKKNILDEMQENKLKTIESMGFWLAFAGLLAAIIIQVLIRPDLKQITGELVVFFAMSAYLVVFCLKNGLWSRTPAPTVKGNVVSSAVAALALGAVLTARSQLILHKGFSVEFAALLLLAMGIAFAGCFATLEVTRALYRRRRRELDHTDGEGGGSENDE